jgi:replicative DNA helicase
MSKSIVELRDVLKVTFDRIDKGRERGDTYSGLPSGYVDLDDMTSGFQSGELIILAGRPSMGKSSLALNMIERIAIEQKKAAAIFSLEMSQEQIARNMLCCHARIDSHKLRRGMLADEEYPRLALAVGRLSEADIYIDDTSGLSCFEIRAKARMLRSRKKLDLLVIDYLQLMEGPNIDSREQQIAQISRGLKGLARELEIPIIAVSQLNRGPEIREEHRPRMSDLRESGAIEQDADVVLLIHRPSQYKWSDESDLSDEDKVTELQIAKQRNGPTGVIRLSFLRQYMRFENCADASNGDRGGPI